VQVGEPSFDESVAEIEAGDGIDVAAGGVFLANDNWQRAEKIPESKQEKPDAGGDVEDVGSRESKDADGLEDAVVFAEETTVVFDVFDDFGAGGNGESERWGSTMSTCWTDNCMRASV